jgi:hypothetical protein
MEKQLLKQLWGELHGLFGLFLLWTVFGLRDQKAGGALLTALQ